MPINSLSRSEASWPKYLIWGYTLGLTISHIFLQVSAVVLFLLLLPMLFLRKELWQSTMNKLILGFFISGLIAFGMVGFDTQYLPKMMPHLVLLGTIPIVYYQRKNNYPEIERWLPLLLALAALASCAGIYFYQQGLPRTKGFFGSYFTLAALLAATIPLTCGLLLRQKSTTKIMLWAGILYLQFIPFWWTYTRSAFLGLFLGLSFWTVIVFVKYMRKQLHLTKADVAKWGIILALPLTLVLLIVTAKDGRINPFYRPPASVAAEKPAPPVNFTSDRDRIVADVFRITGENLENNRYDYFLFGHGLKSRNRLIDNYIGSWEADILQAWMDQGIIGVLLLLGTYVVFLLGIFRGLMANDPISNGLAAAGIAYCLMSLFTLQLTAFNSAGIFALLYTFLPAGKLSTMEPTEK